MISRSPLVMILFIALTVFISNDCNGIPANTEKHRSDASAWLEKGSSSDTHTWLEKERYTESSSQPERKKTKLFSGHSYRLTGLVADPGEGSVYVFGILYRASVNHASVKSNWLVTRPGYKPLQLFATLTVWPTDKEKLGPVNVEGKLYLPRDKPVGTKLRCLDAPKGDWIHDWHEWIKSSKTRELPQPPD